MLLGKEGREGRRDDVRGGGLKVGGPCKNWPRDRSSCPAKVPDPTHPESRWETSFGGTSIFLSWDPLGWVLIRERRSGRATLPGLT